MMSNQYVDRINVVFIGHDREMIEKNYEKLKYYNIYVRSAQSFNSEWFNSVQCDLIICGGCSFVEVDSWEQGGNKITDNYPVIFVNNDYDPIEMIIALETVADDVVSKDVQIEELRARIRSAIRRRKKLDASADAVNHDYFHFCGITADRDRQCLFDGEGKIIKFNQSELSLLFAFIENQNVVLSRKELADLIFNETEDRTDRLVDVRVFRLRKKLDKIVGVNNLIRTVHKRGYMFTATDQERYKVKRVASSLSITRQPLSAFDRA